MNIISKIINNFNQINNTYKQINENLISLYLSFLSSIDIKSLECTCGASNSFIYYGFYPRKVKLPTGVFSIDIQRVRCKTCGHTHALLPPWIVPYSQILLRDYLVIISLYLANSNDYNLLMQDNPYIDEFNIKYIIKKFINHWKSLLDDFNILIDDNIYFNCFKHCSCQFMVIRTGFASLFIPPT